MPKKKSGKPPVPPCHLCQNEEIKGYILKDKDTPFPYRVPCMGNHPEQITPWDEAAEMENE